MPAPISVIMPTRNAADVMPAAIASLMEGLEAGILRELIVSDGGSSDACEDIAEAAGATFISGNASRGGQLRRGCATARGDWLMVIHADSRLQPGWTKAVDTALQSPSAAWHFRLQFDVSGAAAGWVAGWANWRSHALGLPYGDQGLLLPRVLYDSVGGYSDIPLMEDVALAKALRGHHRQQSARIETSASRYQKDGWARHGARNIWRLMKYNLGAAPADLSRNYDHRD
jgi:rSAM/selenodomain-associated transferase 2